MALEFTEQPVATEQNGNSDLVRHFREIYVGAGENRLICNPDGFSIGASSWANAPFRVDWNGNVTASSLVITNGTIKAGQTAYDTGTGYWIGVVSGTPKLSIGNSAGSNKLTWDGTTLTIRGTLNADDIVAGTLTGRTVQTASSGYRVRLNGSSNKVEFLSNDTVKASMYPDSSYDLNIDTSDKINFLRQGTGLITFDYRSSGYMDMTFADGSRIKSSAGGGYLEIHTDKLLFKALDVMSDVNKTKNIGSSSTRWATLYVGGVDADGTISAAGLEGNHYSSDGTQGIDASAFEVVVDVRENSGVEKKYRTLTFKDGLLTARGAVSDWTPV